MKLFLLISLTLSLWACKKFIEVPPPRDEITGETVFTDDASAQAAIAGLYSQLMNTNNTFGNGATTLYPALSADEIYNTAPNVEADQFTQNSLLSENTVVENQLWTRPYRLIYHANAIIEQLQKPSSLTPSVIQLVEGEARFIRGFTYYYLSSLFGDVPLILNTDYNKNAVMPRTPVMQVIAQIETDLQKAVNLLPVVYPSSNRTRPNKYAALALLARLHLYSNNWLKADSAATAVIDAGLYSLPVNLNSVFLPASNEVIWQLMPVISSLNTSEGFLFNPSSATARPAYALTTSLLSAFETGDARKTAWTKTNTVSGSPFTYPFKYKVRSGTAKTEYNVVLRLAEQYLIRAEARAQMNQLQDAVADLNKIRNRAGLPNTTAATKEQILIAIEQERRIELFAEWGHRWLDLKRTGRASTVLSPIKQHWNAEDVLYPIPFRQLLRNPSLHQNPGY